VKFAAMPADDWLKNRAAEFGPIDVIVVDPPRVGLEASLIARIARAKPSRIVYVSCDPATLARDLKRFGGIGYDFESIAAFDMFPQNHHVEAVAHLTFAG
jgi:tRNA/tmRNA/rRNA uracil-C5-methylase (TrmA/RlmC/RlmD family)